MKKLYIRPEVENLTSLVLSPVLVMSDVDIDAVQGADYDDVVIGSW